MASGVPVVATDVGAFSELLQPAPDETGILVPRDDLAALVDNTAILMDDTHRRAAAAANGVSHAASAFSIEREAADLGKLYAALLQDQ